MRRIRNVVMTIANIVAIIVGLLMIIHLFLQIRAYKEDKAIIFHYFTNTLQNCQRTIQKLSNKNFALRTQLQKPEFEGEIRMRLLYGRVVSAIDSRPIPDVKIEVEGASQIFSNSNGEFLISCKLGNRVRFEKDGYAIVEFVIDERNLDRYQKIVFGG